MMISVGYILPILLCMETFQFWSHFLRCLLGLWETVREFIIAFFSLNVLFFSLPFQKIVRRPLTVVYPCSNLCYDVFKAFEVNRDGIKGTIYCSDYPFAVL